MRARSEQQQQQQQQIRHINNNSNSRRKTETTIRTTINTSNNKRQKFFSFPPSPNKNGKIKRKTIRQIGNNFLWLFLFFLLLLLSPWPLPALAIIKINKYIIIITDESRTVSRIGCAARFNWNEIINIKKNKESRA